MLKRFWAWLRPVDEVVLPRDEVAEANAALLAVTKQLPVVLGERDV